MTEAAESSPVAGSAALVISWYEMNRRDLPWRGAHPWGVLVSEVMLQQTPVERVLPVYHSFLGRWPAPPAMAEASPGSVLVAWGTLGYPRRARNLHRSASILTARHGGSVPSDLEALRALPGVGDYSARAVAVFGFEKRHGVVDVNVRRVVARWLDGNESAPPHRRFLDAVENLLPEEPTAAARMSAGLMELGSLVCRRRGPNCDACPLRDECRWRALGFPKASAEPARARYKGSDRQARGALLSVLRAGRVLDAPAARQAVPDTDRRRRALAGLKADALIVRDGREWRLPEIGE